jgi:hypothetical protein
MGAKEEAVGVGDAIEPLTSSPAGAWHADGAFTTFTYGVCLHSKMEELFPLLY